MSICGFDDATATLTVSPIELELAPPIAQIILQRSPVNALDAAMLDHFEDALAQIERCKDVSVVVLRSGAREFCAGADLSTVAGFLDKPEAGAALRAYAGRLQRLIDRFEALSAVTVCAVDGIAAGGGFEIALAADFRLASDRASFSLPELALGLIPAAGGTQRLVRLAGLGMARRIILRGATLDARQARRGGIVDEVFPADTFEASVREFANECARASAAAVKAAKACLRQASPLASCGLATELDEIAQLIEGQDARQRLTRFLGRRQHRTQQAGT
ncbi:enoyl-CoA hydratase/isomerase family protein [Bradyrhizobium sp. NP1]|uniref:enoyl-CoA hydratase/isomerase family protein n=1 Tax=Bradyrhizobium sp. NP1 TaxID=3049772 RepID=UPI0025A4CF71|nr:enoyl-CoA hydratase/isomerase family protein [Bradyrhizobium sp. NP1]WJR76773.1 enoyl-CoA hydratase/isomerase family protein [Bradyrhizobium sp. NP1]